LPNLSKKPGPEKREELVATFIRSMPTCTSEQNVFLPCSLCMILLAARFLRFLQKCELREEHVETKISIASLRAKIMYLFVPKITVLV